MKSFEKFPKKIKACVHLLETQEYATSFYYKSLSYHTMPFANRFKQYHISRRVKVNVYIANSLLTVS